ncbi:MAG: hypothetical protein ABJF10_25230 [Chthoniobacter sp.]
MNREFHIFASDFDTQFTMKGTPEDSGQVFSSLFEAARHARSASGSDAGEVVIYGGAGETVNRIPFCILPRDGGGAL